MVDVLFRVKIEMLWAFTVFVVLGLPKLDVGDQIGAGTPLQPALERLSVVTAASLVLFAMPFLGLT